MLQFIPSIQITIKSGENKTDFSQNKSQIKFITLTIFSYVNI